jgi:hypothetical protein
VKFLATLLLVLVAGPAVGQTRTSFTCGSFAVESWKTGATTNWTIASAGSKATESAALRSGPKLQCLEGAVLVIEFVAANGSTFLDLHFPDGGNINYGGQHLVRNGRYVLPVQAKRRIEPRYQAAFDYHCRLELPIDPIKPDVRKDCVL